MKEVIIVEDDINISELIKFLLIEENFSVQAFSTVGAFKKRSLSRQPDLFLLDIRLPDGNGVDLCKELKYQKDTLIIPVVLMSAHVNQKELKLSCADDFISKPFDINVLIDKIHQHINKVGPPEGVE